jgi:hypothetical protein
VSPMFRDWEATACWKLPAQAITAVLRQKSDSGEPLPVQQTWVAAPPPQHLGQRDAMPMLL